MIKKISSAQMRAARALLRWSALDLASASKVGVATIRRAEVVDGEIPVTLANEAALRRALEAAGVEFIDENGGGLGVRTKWNRTGNVVLFFSSLLGLRLKTARPNRPNRSSQARSKLS